MTEEIEIEIEEGETVPDQIRKFISESDLKAIDEAKERIERQRAASAAPPNTTHKPDTEIVEPTQPPSLELPENPAAADTPELKDKPVGPDEPMGPDEPVQVATPQDKSYALFL